MIKYISIEVDIIMFWIIKTVPDDSKRKQSVENSLMKLMKYIFNFMFLHL